MPLPNTRVIHPGWSAHHQPVAEGAMTAECVITAPESAAAVTFDEATGHSTTTPGTPLFTGACKVTRAVATENHGDTADRETTVREYYVSLPADAPAAPVNSIITITACPDDESLVDRTLRVREVRFASLRWQRDLVCEDVSPVSR